MNNFPAMTEEQRQQMVNWLEEGIACRDEYGFSGNVLKSMQIALAALTSPPAPVLRVPDEVFEKAYNQHLNGLLCGDNNKTAAKEFLQDCINSQSAPPEASNEQ